MKKSQPSAAPRNYLGRREQVRLLTMVFTLGLVVIMMSEAAKPKNWYWLWGGRPPEKSPLTDNLPKPPDESQAVDGRLRPGAGSSERDEPVVVASNPSNTEDSWEDFEGMVYAEHLLPGVRREDLDAIRDDVAFSREETEIFHRWLVQCDHLGSQRLAERSLGATTYLQLFKQSEVYRGRVVSMQGTVRRALRVHANENESGAETYYQLWLQPEDRPTMPVVVYCLRLPEGFPVATEVREQVRLTAVPLKRWPYLAQDTMRLAPLVVAATVEWRPAVAATENETTPLQIAAVVMAAGLLAAMAVTMIVRRTNQPFSTKHSPFAAAFQAAKVAEAGDASVDAGAVASMRVLADQRERSDESEHEVDHFHHS